LSDLSGKFSGIKKPDFSEKSGFSENFTPKNFWNLTYQIAIGFIQNDPNLAAPVLPRFVKIM